LSVIKAELEDKIHFINYLNDKIKAGIDNKLLRKISNIYLKHSMKKDHKMRIELDQLDVGAAGRGNNSNGNSNNSNGNNMNGNGNNMNGNSMNGNNDNI
jgi:hypothetical protein